MNFISRKVLSVHFPTSHSAQFFLEKKSNESYISGQFIQLEIDINGSKLLREYSLCSIPSDDALSFVVKKFQTVGFHRIW